MTAELYARGSLIADAGAKAASVRDLGDPWPLIPRHVFPGSAREAANRAFNFGDERPELADRLCPVLWEPSAGRSSQPHRPRSLITRESFASQFLSRSTEETSVVSNWS